MSKTNPNYYKGSVETWDYILAHGLGFLEGNIIKYVTRWKQKDGIQDLEKAKAYLEKLIEHIKLQQTQFERLNPAEDDDRAKPEGREPSDDE